MHSDNQQADSRNGGGGWVIAFMLAVVVLLLFFAPTYAFFGVLLWPILRHSIYAEPKSKDKGEGLGLIAYLAFFALGAIVLYAFFA